MYYFTSVTEAEENVAAATAQWEEAEMAYDVAVIVGAAPSLIEETQRELAASFAAYCESMEDLTDTENAFA